MKNVFDENPTGQKPKHFWLTYSLCVTLTLMLEIAIEWINIKSNHRLLNRQQCHQKLVLVAWLLACLTNRALVWTWSELLMLKTLRPRFHSPIWHDAQMGPCVPTDALRTLNLTWIEIRTSDKYDWLMPALRWSFCFAMWWLGHFCCCAFDSVNC